MPKDFSHQDLRGKSFKGQDLTGADFSHADIRGVSFKGAILKGANFANVKGGVTKKSFAEYLGRILILSSLMGFLIFVCNCFVAILVRWVMEKLYVDTDANTIIYTSLFSIIYVSASTILIREGKYNLWDISFITAVAVTVTIVIAVVEAGAIAIGLVVAGVFVGAIVGAVVGAGIGAVAGAIAGFGVESVAIAIAVVGTGVGAVAGAIASFGTGVGAVVGAGAVATLIQLILFAYIAYRTSKEDEQFDTYRKLGLSLSSLFGANFDGADLTDANFSKASLKYCRFSKETIILRTSFQNAENLKFARLRGTILENKAARELLVTGNGKNQSYAGMNLKGAYLVGADLSGADFHEADLIGATLENANLRDTNLSRIQALGVEFRGADFTGACLEAWNIDSTTQLDGANADYVYLLSNKLERRPASGNFGEGEFAKLFNEVLDTVDFIFRNGIDWQAFMISFDKLREKIRVESEDAEISIQSIANKGDGVFVIKVNVPLDADKAEIHSTLTKEYDMNLRLIEAKYQAQLETKDKEIGFYREKSTDFKEIITVLASNIRTTTIYGDVCNSQVISGDKNSANG